MDLLTDASGRKYGENGERHRRIAVANDLKDIAADENVWVVVTYQSTIESQEWLNDEKNVLTEYNTAEAKGLARPLTHLITLNQSLNERKEHTMRINVAKSRFSSVEMCSKLLPTMTMRYSTIDNVQSTSIRLNSYVLYKQGGKGVSNTRA